MELKVAIVINENTLQAITEAEATWPELAGNRSAILRKIASDWLYNRQDNSKRASLARIEEVLGIILEMMTHEHDTDHA